MCEMRLAQKGEIVPQKEIWKLCFGDPDSYIDFYYINRYKAEETALLLTNGKIISMLTMIPVKMVFPDNQSFTSAMLYAIATRPEYRNRGFAAQLIDYSNNFLAAGKNGFSVLVPANKNLFAYYRNQGYQDGFYLRESLLTGKEIKSLPAYKPCNCTISPITSEEYNRRRNKQLKGRLFISYSNQDIAYQKTLSQQSGADIYALDMEKDIEGCITIERISTEKLLIKEILIPEAFISLVIKSIAQQLPAKEYIVRTPSYLGEKLGGLIRPFGMVKVLKESDLPITPEKSGYLGIAFD